MPLLKRELSLGMEDVPPGEDKAIEEIVKISREDMNVSRRPVLRGQHPKSHGCVWAKFIVDPDVPDELRYGIFANPGSSYDALVRFSSTRESDDSKRDTRGMAIKLLRDGETYQDFVMINHPVFIVRNAADYVLFARATVRAKHSRLLRKYPSLPRWIKSAIPKAILFNRFFFVHWKELIIVIKIAMKPPRNLLDIQYWSATPYRLGPHAIKFSARPTSLAGDPCQSLRDSLRQDLLYQGSSFDFLVQRQIDAKTMPIEDPTQEWDALKSRFMRVATLKIPSQDPGDAQEPCLCENFSFSPWHALPEHVPLGGINRVRRRVYDAVSERRRDLNRSA